LFLSLGLPALAQPQAAQQMDPLLSLLMSQPRLERGVPVTATAVFDPPAISPGGDSIYRVTLNAIEASIDWPETIVAPPQLALREGARGQLLQMAGTNMEAKTSFLYHTRPTEEGRYRVPAFTIRVGDKDVQVPSAELAVSALVPPGTPFPHRLYVELPPQPIYVGQPVRPRIYLPFPFGAIQMLTQVTLNGQGFILDPNGLRQRIEPHPQRGTNLISFVHEPLLIPIASGKLRFTAQGWSMVNRTVMAASTTNPAYATEVSQTLVDSDPVEFLVKPLPPPGDLPGFTGAVGFYTNDPPKLSTNAVRVGDPIKLRVTFRSDSSITRFVPPPAPESADWQVFEASGDPTPVNLIVAQGATTFTYTMVPLKHGVLTTPPIPWAYFDPRRGAYVSLQIPPVRVLVTPGPFATAPEVFAQVATNKPGTPPQPSLSPLAPAPGMALASLRPIQSQSWFPVIQALPAFFFLGLWQWDRRRRFLARHPEIVRRRRARRELRRQRRRMRAAAQRQDASAFGDCAVEALRAAIAPYYPARPHALVGADVLRVVGESDPAADAVRAVFAATDAARFSAEEATDREHQVLAQAPTAAPHPASAAELLSLQPILERVLEKLDQDLSSRSRGSSAPSSATGAARLVAILFVTTLAVHPAFSSPSPDPLFAQATNAYARREYAQAAAALRSLAARAPASGTLQNLGNAEWQLGRVGEAILAWEQALWIDPYNSGAKNNLSFARLTAQLEAPELTWYEVISTWLPLNAWPWIAGCTLWLAVGMVLLPGILGQAKAAWHQAVAAFSLMLFLLSLPGQAGIYSRRSLGVVLAPETELRLTPTRHAQILSRLAPGEPVRVRREKGSYVLVRTSRFTGWIEQKQLGLICP